MSRFLILSAVIMSFVVGCQRSDLPETHDVLYVHLYSNRYDIDSMSSDLPPPPRRYQCIATIGWEAGSYLYADLPNHYEPEMHFEGKIRMAGRSAIGDLEIWVQDVGTATEQKVSGSVPLETFQRFEFDDAFYFVVSRSQEPLDPSGFLHDAK